MQTILNNLQMFLNSDIKTFILSIIWFFSISLLLAYYLNKKQGETYVLSIIVSGLVLYIGGLIKHISFAYYISWIIIALLIIIVLIRRKGKELIKHIDQFAAISFSAVLLILFVIYQNVAFRYTDEFMHWGPMVREMARIDRFYCASESNLLVHKDYPPFFSLVELLFCLFKGEYVEKYLYIGLMSFVYSIILYVVSINRNRKINKVLFISFVLAGLLFQYLPNAKDSIGLYNSVYIDYVLAFYVFYLFYRIIKEKENITFFEYSILFSSLLLTKQISIFFFAISILLMIDKKEKIDIEKIIYVLLIPILAFISWKIVVGVNQVNGQFNISNFSIKAGTLSIIKNFVKLSLLQPLFYQPFKLSLTVCAILIFIFLFIIKRSNIISNKSFITLIIGFVGYLAVLCFMYCFAFSIEEALSSASFERYVLTIVFIYVLLIIAFVINTNNLFASLIVFASLILLADLNNSYLYKITNRKNIIVVKQWGENISLDKTKDNGSVITFKEREYIGEDVSSESLLEELSKYNYVYIFKYDDIFYQRWKKYTNGALLENDSLYLINKEDSNIEFINDNYSSVYYEIKYYLHIDEE